MLLLHLLNDNFIKGLLQQVKHKPSFIPFK